MPIFEYSCRKCQHRFEAVVLSAREEIACPRCRSGDPEKLPSVFNSPTSGTKNSSGAVACACTPQTCGCH